MSPSSAPSVIAASPCLGPFPRQRDRPVGSGQPPAWSRLAPDHPFVMQLGPTPTPDQVRLAMCTDVRTSTIPIELSAEEIASRYYGWRFGIDPATEILTCGKR